MIDERHVQVEHVSIHLRTWGDEGTPVVFWHALGDHSSMQMAEVGPILVNDYGLQVVGFDAPGFGGSAPRLPDAGYEVEALTPFIAKLLDALELDRPAWVGSSWGAVLGIACGGGHPDKIRAVALLDGGYFEDPDEELMTYSLDALREEERKRPDYRWPSWEAVYAEIREWAGRWSPELERYAHSVMREEGGEVVSIMGPDVMAAGMHAILHADLADLQARLGRTGLPVLLLAGGSDFPELAEKRELSLQHFQSRIPQAEIRRVEAPHLMLEAQPAEVARVLGPWLRSHG